jgi:TrkA family protein
MQTAGKPPAFSVRTRRRRGVRPAPERVVLEPVPCSEWNWPERELAWVRRMRRRMGPRRYFVFLALVVLTLVLGYWGFRELDLSPKLNFGQSLYHAFKLFVFDLGPAGGAGAKHGALNPQIVAASILAALLVMRAFLAIAGGRLGRWLIRFRSGHAIVCGAGVHGSELVRTLAKRRKVVLVDPDPSSAGMQERLGDHEWRVVGDAAQAKTLRAAGVGRAHWVVAIAGNAFVNSQIVATIHQLAREKSIKDGLHVIVQMEDPRLARFLEEDLSPLDAKGGKSRNGAHGRAPAPVITPFSPNEIAAEGLVEKKEEGRPLASDRRGPHLILAGDHQLLDAIMLEASRQWRIQILQDLESRSTWKRPPFRVSLYGPDAVNRKDAFVRRWNPESQVLEIEAKDAEAGRASVEEDQWLHDRREQARHAIVVCNQEVEGVRLTLGISGALGGGLEVTRVATQRKSVLDERLKERTAMADVATATVEDIAQLGSDAVKMSRDARQRLVETLADDLGTKNEKKGADREQARVQAATLIGRPELRLHTDSTWRTLPAEQPLVRALVDPVPVSVLLRARLAVDLGKPDNLRYAAEQLTENGERLASFVAWCEYVRHVARDSQQTLLTDLELETGDEVADELLGLARDVLPRMRARRNGDPGTGPLSTVNPHVVVFAGDPGRLSRTTRAAFKPLLESALEGYEGVVYSPMGAGGAQSLAAEVADDLGVVTRPYAPENGHGAHACLRMWRDLVADGIEPEDVPVVACPAATSRPGVAGNGGDPTLDARPRDQEALEDTAEIILARSLGAQVAWLDPAGEADAALADSLPLGAEGVRELPPDGMTLRALFRRSRAPDEIREQLAKDLHADYRRRQRRRKPAADPALAPWDRLLPALQRSNLNQADDIPNKLAAIGKRLDRNGSRLTLAEDEVEKLGEMEHGRFVVERLFSGWQLGERNVGRLESHDLVPWDELPKDIKKYDYEAVQAMDPALELVGWGVVDA